MTMTLVSTVTVGAGGAASIDFTSIPQTGTDLLIVSSLRTNGAESGSVLGVRFNGLSGSIYTVKRLYGSGSAASSDGIQSTYLYRGWKATGTDFTASTFANNQMYIANYAGSTNKSVSFESVTENNATAADQTLVAGIMADSAAITSIAITPVSGNSFVQYSTASLYTITKGSGGASVS